MRRKPNNNQRHLCQFLKVIKSPVSAIIVRMRCSHLFKLACALTQLAQLDCSNECRCEAPLTSSRLLECTIRTFPHPTRTQIMSATFFSLPLDLFVFDMLQVVQQIMLYVVPPHCNLHHRSTVHDMDHIVFTAYTAVRNARFYYFVKFLDFRSLPISLFTKTFCQCSVFTCFV
jgi:hypothetical protein